MSIPATRVVRTTNHPWWTLIASALPSAQSRLSAPRSHARLFSEPSNVSQVSTRSLCLQGQLKPSSSRSFASLAGSSSAPSEPNALQVTDPLLIYRAKVARGELEEDEEQLRALIELRRINRVLRDYVPPAHLLGILHDDSQSASSAALASAIDSRLRPGAREYQDDPTSRVAPSRKQGDQVNELVKWLSESEGLAELGTPKGLLITGTPGTGKSMVMDIFYDSLPSKYKFRRHYHHLLLDLYRIIWDEAERRRLAVRQGMPRATATPEMGTGAVWSRDRRASSRDSTWKRALRGMPFFRPDSLAHEAGEQLQYVPGPDGDVVKTTLPLHAAAHLFLKYGHILLFDEIQLVDVASAGLLRRTLEAYWRLGGVVIGTSNRIPKDLYASNVHRAQLTQFLEILQERCPNHEMRNSRDFRREPFYRQEWLKRNQESHSPDSSFSVSQATGQGASQSPAQTSYFLRSERDKFSKLVEETIENRKAEPTTLSVYGRKLHVPRSIAAADTLPSVCRFTFSELCDSPLGPADYLTLASNYHTFILEDVPQMTLMQKNQARRMITLLDAVYEAGCRLIVLADAGPDQLFFPDAEGAARHAARGPAAGPGDVRPELQYRPDHSGGTMEDVVDMSTKGGVSPFLTPPPGQLFPEEEQLARHKARQRIDFNVDEFMTDSLIMAETLSEAMQDTDEGFRPNISAYSSSRPSRSSQDQKPPNKHDKAGFQHLAIFTGEDERFSYQRAVSRLFEMSHPDWKQRKGWRPFLAKEMQAWGGKSDQEAEKISAVAPGETVVVEELDEPRYYLDRTVAAAEATAQMSSADRLDGSVDANGDFAEEASYEGAQTKLQREMEEWATRKREQEGKKQAVEKRDGEADFSAGPIGKKRNRDQGPPVLSESHIWGVREDWGKKAGAWGKGSAIYTHDSCVSTDTSDEGAAERRPDRAWCTRSGGSGLGLVNRPGRREFCTSSVLCATLKPLDHYSTLQVGRTASQAQIKAQFYKLSKELHPDINPSQDAKTRFQQVSEAYATLGTPAKRKTYDLESSSSSSYGGYGDNVGGGGYTYNANDNVKRRARATYAWEYQRQHGRPRTSSQTSQTSTGGTMYGASDSSVFETMAARQRAREQRNQARTRIRARETARDAYTSEQKAYQAQVANPLIRFGQVLLMLYLIFKAGTLARDTCNTRQNRKP